MPGVNHVQPEPRYSASNWYTNVDASLMGVQSTEQFINKYHHVIGKIFTMTKFMFHKKEHEEAGNRGFRKNLSQITDHARKTRLSLIRFICRPVFIVGSYFKTILSKTLMRLSDWFVTEFKVVLSIRTNYEYWL